MPKFHIPTEGIRENATIDAFNRVADTFSNMTQEGPAASKPKRAEFGSQYFETDGEHRIWWYVGMGLGDGGLGWLRIHTEIPSMPGALPDPTRGALMVGNATPAWAALAHPGAANRVLQSSALDTAWSGFALAVEAASAINQDLTTDAAPLFDHLHLLAVNRPEALFTRTADVYSLLHIAPHAHDNLNLLLDCYFDGQYRSSSVASNLLIYKGGATPLAFYIGSGVALGGIIGTWVTPLAMNTAGQTLHNDGSGAAPAISFINQTTLGIRRVSAGLAEWVGGDVRLPSDKKLLLGSASQQSIYYDSASSTGWWV